MSASLKIGFSVSYSDKEIIKELLSPWRFQISPIDEADVIISRANMSPELSGKIILIPDGSQKFSHLFSWCNHGLLRKEKWRQFNVSVTESLSLGINAETLYSYGASESLLCGCLVNDFIYCLRVDVVAEYIRLLNETFNSKPSMRYQLFTSFPIPYTKAPKRLRDIVMTHKTPDVSLNYSDKLPLDALRFMLFKAIETLTKEKMEFTGLFLGKKKTAYLITHDVDTRGGLNRAPVVKKLEEKYDVPSTWFIPATHYPLDSNIVRKLANHGEVGAHDTDHDGKLASLSGQRIINRLEEAKRILEKTGNCSVNGFRAPLLQHTFPILEGLKNARYSYDSSVPTYEPNHPRTMGPHGLGTVFPTKISDTLEIPVTIIQDHQLLYTLGLKPQEVINQWGRATSLIETLGGCCLILSHPEYAMHNTENLSLYEEFLNKLSSDNNVLLCLPSDIAK